MTQIEASAGYADPHRVAHGGMSGSRRHVSEHAARGPESKRIIVGFGFWIFLLSDIVMFSALFATYAVLVGQTAGGPSGPELFDLRNTGIETACLLLSSFTCGIGSIGALTHRGSWFYGAMVVTFGGNALTGWLRSRRAAVQARGRIAELLVALLDPVLAVQAFRVVYRVAPRSGASLSHLVTHSFVCAGRPEKAHEPK